MKTKVVWFMVVMAALLMSAAIPLCAQEAEKKPPLRRPGFVFLELNTSKIDAYLDFFAAVMGFKVTFHQPGYAQMETDSAQLLFMDPAGLPKGHPFYELPPGGKRGYGVEIGLIVADLDKSYAAALTFKDKGWQMSSGIAMRPWGVRDFRVLAPDGYYLRFSEPPATAH